MRKSSKRLYRSKNRTRVRTRNIKRKTLRTRRTRNLKTKRKYIKGGAKKSRRNLKRGGAEPTCILPCGTGAYGISLSNFSFEQGKCVTKSNNKRKCNLIKIGEEQNGQQLVECINYPVEQPPKRPLPEKRGKAPPKPEWKSYFFPNVDYLSKVYQTESGIETPYRFFNIEGTENVGIQITPDKYANKKIQVFVSIGNMAYCKEVFIKNKGYIFLYWAKIKDSEEYFFVDGRLISDLENWVCSDDPNKCYSTQRYDVDELTERGEYAVPLCKSEQKLGSIFYKPVRNAKSPFSN